ncbi:MAG: cell division protein SepF [Nanoarchaeota archaeon]|nr:cell division protein SepF [DPANN group archaeon]MBL7116527.1 cell division protein SepF [Nanoarchaeota archaeon]
MKSLFSLKKLARKHDDDIEEGAGEEEYVEIDTEAERDKTSKIIVRPFVMEDFSDIKEILDSLREGYTIALINIKPLKDKDLVELKRAINKLKKTCDAIDGDIAGFGDDYVVVTPSFAEIFRTKSTNNIGED